MEDNFKGFKLLTDLMTKNEEFRDKIHRYIECGLIRLFDDREWEKIKKQNFMYANDDMKDFYDVFVKGLNIGSCKRTGWQLSYSYDDVDIVEGDLPILIGTLNAEKFGGHCWLETKDTIIDTSFLLVIDKSLKDEFGYHETERATAEQLARAERYQEPKRYVNDESIRTSIHTK